MHSPLFAEGAHDNLFSNPLNPKSRISGQTWSVFIPERPEKRPSTQNNHIGVKLFSVYTLKAQNFCKGYFNVITLILKLV